MATAEAASEGGCSEPARRFACVLVDPIRDATIEVDAEVDGHAPTLRDVLRSYRSSALETPAGSGSGEPGPDLERRRFADGLFPLDDSGNHAEPIPGLRFRIGGRACDLDYRLNGEGPGPVRIEIDRSQSGYPRDWPAYSSRRWGLRAGAYSRFVESVVEQAYGPEAGSILRLDAPDRVRRFLAAVARRIYAAPYETYSRYLGPGARFKGCDQTLDRILEGDGGNCAEKAMVLYFIARAYGIGAEVILGGEEASGKFPHRALRSVLDQRTFDDEATLDAQRHWQHYAILFRPTGDDADDVLCDVAGSNIPYLFLAAEEASTYLGPARRMPLRVVITLEPIRLYYHRLASRQDLPLDLYYAMEHLIKSIDIIHTVNNELGLLHAGNLWVGAVASRGRRGRDRVVREYGRFVGRRGLDPRADLCFARELAPARHPLLDRFLAAHPREAGRIIEADARLRERLDDAMPGAELEYVLIRLRHGEAGLGSGQTPAGAISRCAAGGANPCPPAPISRLGSNWTGWFGW